jgi:hypothetical protein
MANVIVLTSDQAAQVSGTSKETPLAALQPVSLTDGRFILGVEVLTDPAHAEDAAFLSTLPQVDFSTVASLMPGATP